MCIRRVCCCLFTGSAGRVFLLGTGEYTDNAYKHLYIQIILFFFHSNKPADIYLISISAKLFASKKTEEELLVRFHIKIKAPVGGRCYFTSEPLKPLLSPPPPQHQQSYEDHHNAH